MYVCFICTLFWGMCRFLMGFVGFLVLFFVLFVAVLRCICCCDLLCLFVWLFWNGCFGVVVCLSVLKCLLFVCLFWHVCLFVSFVGLACLFVSFVGLACLFVCFVCWFSIFVFTCWLAWIFCLFLPVYPRPYTSPTCSLALATVTSPSRYSGPAITSS